MYIELLGAPSKRGSPKYGMPSNRVTKVRDARIVDHSGWIASSTGVVNKAKGQRGKGITHGERWGCSKDVMAGS